jgi:hypothetical protein
MLRPASIFRLVLFAWSGTGILAVPILAGLYWKGATKQGAVAASVAGIAVLLLVTFQFPAWSLGFHPIVVAAATAAVLMIAVSWLTMPASARVLEQHFTVLAKTANPLTARFLLLFAALYFVVWLPARYIFPWKEYIPGFYGVPLFVWVWLGVQATVAMALLAYKRHAARIGVE